MSTPTTPEFNSSEPWGGDPLTTDVNAQYAGLEYHYTYLVFCGFIVWLIIPGIGLLYGGLARRKSSLSLLFQSLMVASVTTFQWMFWGYSLAYSRTANAFIGDLTNFGMMKVRAAPSPGSAVIPEVSWIVDEGLMMGRGEADEKSEIDRLLPVPNALLRLHRANRYRRFVRAWSHPAFTSLCLLLGHGRLLPHCVLDLEQ